MPSAKIVQIADAVVATLEAADLGPPLAVARDYAPAYRLEDLRNRTHVTVVPKGTVEALNTRAAVQATHQIDVAVQGTGATLEERDALMDLTETVAALFRMERLAGCPDAVCVSIERQALYDRDHLREYGVMTTALTLTFDTME